MIQLVVCDLDGTLLPKGEEQLESRVFEVIADLKAKGISFAVASGRTYHELKRLFRPVEQDIYFIASDGALMVHREQTLFQQAISKRIVANLSREAQRQELPGILFSGKYLSYYRCNCPHFSEYVQKSLHGHALEVKRAEEISKSVLKVSFYGKKKIILPPDLAPMLSEVYDGREWQDFVCPSVNKLCALEDLRRRLAVSTDETLVFGDNSNDVAMLQSTPLSYAVKGAKQAAKLAANYQTEDVVSTIAELTRRN